MQQSNAARGVYLRKTSDGAWLKKEDLDKRFEAFASDTLGDAARKMSDATASESRPASPDRLEMRQVEGMARTWCLSEAPAWKWKRDYMHPNAVEAARLFFVGRDGTIKRLQELHEQNYNQLTQAFGGDVKWTIPVADNAIGTGTSALGVLYPYKCCEMWPDPSQRTSFQQLLCVSHSVHVQFLSCELVRGDVSFDAAIIRAVIRRLRMLFPASAFEFLSELTDQVGPLVIVLEDVGVAFLELVTMNYGQSNEKFHAFCREVLVKWFLLPKVHLLITGQLPWWRPIEQAEFSPSA